MNDIEQRLREEAATYANHQTERYLLIDAADHIATLTGAVNRYNQQIIDAANQVEALAEQRDSAYGAGAFDTAREMYAMKREWDARLFRYEETAMHWWDTYHATRHEGQPCQNVCAEARAAVLAALIEEEVR